MISLKLAYRKRLVNFKVALVELKARCLTLQPVGENELADDYRWIGNDHFL